MIHSSSNSYRPRFQTSEDNCCFRSSRHLMVCFRSCCCIENKPLHHCPRVLLHCQIHDMNRCCHHHKKVCYLSRPQPLQHTPGRWCSQCLATANARQLPFGCRCLSSSPKALLMIRLPRPPDTGYCRSRIHRLSISCRPRFSVTSCMYRPYTTGCPPFQASCSHLSGWSMHYQSISRSR